MRQVVAGHGTMAGISSSRSIGLLATKKAITDCATTCMRTTNGVTQIVQTQMFPKLKILYAKKHVSITVLGYSLNKF